MRRWVVGVLLLWGQATGAPTAGGVSASVVVDATATDGSLGVTMRWRGLPVGVVKMHPLADDGYTVSQVQFSADGPLESTQAERHFEVRTQGELEVSYRVTPGGIGRHGRQGAVESDWAMVDGRIFMVPQGGVDPARIDLSFVLPDGWVAATPFQAEGDGFVLEPKGALSADDQLQGACFGLGRFSASTGPGYTSWSYDGWPDAHREELRKGTGEMVAWFRDHIGLKAPYTTVWSPKSDETRVFGGSWGLGTCYEFPPGLPKDRVQRNWQLLGHRLAHAQNKYAPESLVIRDQRDHWFLEGWAAYAEVIATEAVGLAGDGAYMNRLYDRHHAMIDLKPHWEIALRDEPRVSVEVHEHVHYTTAPLAVAELDFWMQQRSGRSVASFVKWLLERHGQFRGAVDLRGELETFTGHNYDDFWALFIDRAGPFPPVWPGALGDPKERVATAAGMPVDRSLVRALARHGNFERFSHLRDFLVHAHRRLADLDRRGVKIVPNKTRAELDRLSGRAHAEVLQLAMSYPIELAPEPLSRGCSGPIPLPDSVWRADPKSATGMKLDRLLALEADAVRDRVARTAVRFRGDTPVETLVVGDADDLQLMVQWVTPPDAIEIELEQDGEVVFTKKLSLGATWARTWSTFPAHKRRKGESVLLFRIKDAHGVRATTVVWQVPGSLQ